MSGRRAQAKNTYSVTIKHDSYGKIGWGFLNNPQGSKFYLEAVRVGVPPAKVAEDRRLAEVHAVLDSVIADQFVVDFGVRSIGKDPLSTVRLRRELRQWLQGLDPSAVAASATPGSGFADLPGFSWVKDDWHLEFRALPLKPEAAGREHRFVGVIGTGEARYVDNVTGMLGVLNTKANRYGKLDAPLVIALMSNTEFPTEDHEVEQALFGASIYRPAQSALQPTKLFHEGHWLTQAGWRRGHAPQVIAVQELLPWTITKIQPRLWNTLEPGITFPDQPTWLSPATVTGPEPKIIAGQHIRELFGLSSGWLAGGPEFKLGKQSP